jgi:hypothetical protein
MLLSCFSPSSAPTGTWEANPSCTEETGAQITIEKRESMTTGLLTTTNTRDLLGS